MLPVLNLILRPHVCLEAVVKRLAHNPVFHNLIVENRVFYPW